MTLRAISGVIGTQGLEDPLGIFIHGDDDNMHCGQQLLDLGRAFHARGVGQLNVQQHHVRHGHGDFLQRLRHGGAGPDALETRRPVEQRLEPLAHGLVVFHDADFDHNNLLGSGA